MLRFTVALRTAAVAAVANPAAATLNLYKSHDAEVLLQRQREEAAALVAAARMDAPAWAAKFMRHHPAGGFRHSAPAAGTAGGATANGAYVNAAHFQDAAAGGDSGVAFSAPVNMHEAPVWSIAAGTGEQSKVIVPPFVVALFFWLFFHDFCGIWSDEATGDHLTLVAQRRAKVQAKLQAGATALKQEDQARRLKAQGMEPAPAVGALQPAH
jgi:hypothetical protein